jgi:hypothetical protein
MPDKEAGMEPKECQHKWEDAQLRTTRDGQYILSVDYCALCGVHDLSYRLILLEARFTATKKRLEDTEADCISYSKQVHNLTTRLAAAEQQAQTLRAALARYGKHELGCDYEGDDEPVCVCGFDAALNPQSVGASDELPIERATKELIKRGKDMIDSSPKS